MPHAARRTARARWSCTGTGTLTGLPDVSAAREYMLDCPVNMAHIDIKKAHTLPLDEAKKRAEEIAKNMEAKFGIHWTWDGDQIAFDTPSGMAKGVKGSLTVNDKEAHIAIDLPLLLRAMKGSIEAKVREKLDTLA